MRGQQSQGLSCARAGTGRGEEEVSSYVPALPAAGTTQVQQRAVLATAEGREQHNGNPAYPAPLTPAPTRVQGRTRSLPRPRPRPRVLFSPELLELLLPGNPLLPELLLDPAQLLCLLLLLLQLRLQARDLGRVHADLQVLLLQVLQLRHLRRDKTNVGRSPVTDAERTGRAFCSDCSPVLLKRSLSQPPGLSCSQLLRSRTGELPILPQPPRASFIYQQDDTSMPEEGKQNNQLMDAPGAMPGSITCLNREKPQAVFQVGGKTSTCENKKKTSVWLPLLLICH